MGETIGCECTHCCAFSFTPLPTISSLCVVRPLGWSPGGFCEHTHCCAFSFTPLPTICSLCGFCTCNGGNHRMRTYALCILVHPPTICSLCVTCPLGHLVVFALAFTAHKVLQWLRKPTCSELEIFLFAEHVSVLKENIICQ